MTDLERDIADALKHRAGGVTNGDLRRGEPPHRRWWLPALAAAAVVAALAAGIAVAVSRDHGGGPAAPAAGTSTSAVVGPEWDLVQVSTAGFTTARRPGVRITFHHGGTLDADDGVNHYSGRYRLAGDRVVPDQLAGTLAGYAGHDRAVLTVLDAMSVLLQHGARISSLDAHTLVLVARQYTLTFHARRS